MKIDPSSFATEYTGGIAVELTVGVLRAVGQRLRDWIQGTPREQALIRCYQAASTALLPQGHPAQEAYLSVVREFLAQPAVEAEMAKLVKGRTPDVDTLADAFEEAQHVTEELPPFDFRARLAASVEAFLDAAESEPDLHDTIQTAQLRDAVTHLESLDRGVRVIEREMTKPAKVPVLRLVACWQSGGGYVPILDGGRLVMRALGAAGRLGTAVSAGSYVCKFGLGLLNLGEETARDIVLDFDIEHAGACELAVREARVRTRPYRTRNPEQNVMGFRWQLGGDFVCHPGAGPEVIGYLDLIAPYSEAGKLIKTRFVYVLYATGMEPTGGEIPAEISWPQDIR